MSSMRDFADKSYLSSRKAVTEETPVQKIGAAIALGIFIVAMVLMMFAGPSLQSVVH